MSRLDEIKARCDAATPGPWSAADERELWREDDPSIEPSWCVSQMRPGFEAMSPTEGYVGDVFTTAGFFESTRADAAFIANAREDVPWLVDQVESLERWKFEALEVMSGLRELGKALGLRPGVQITGPAALAEVARLTDLCDEFRKREESQDRIRERLNAEVERLRGWIDRSERQEARARRAEAEVERLTTELAEVKRTYTPCDLDLLTERDALAAQVARVEALAEEWDGDDSCDNRTCVPHRSADALRDALAGSDADTTDTQPTDQEDQA